MSAVVTNIIEIGITKPGADWSKNVQTANCLRQNFYLKLLTQMISLHREKLIG
jgi:hypothetical protein|tara:strand:- start:8855 stop:9013 length:159 start_codon:yes stop_codon:yes gene_type:complete